MYRLLVIGGLLAALFGCGAADEAPASDRSGGVAEPAHTLLVAAEPAPINREVAATVRSLDHFQVAAEVDGRILRTTAEVGDRVAAGLLLAELDASVLTAQRDAAQAAFDLALSEKERVQRLVEGKVAPPRELEAVVSLWKRAAADLAVAAEGLARTQVRAPLAGVVEARWLSAGDLAYPGKALYSLYDPARLLLEAQVPVEDRAAVALGTLLDWELEGHVSRAAVSEVAPSSDPRSRTLRVRLALQEEGAEFLAGLAPGSFGLLRYQIGTRPRLAVPHQAVTRSGQLALILVEVPGAGWRRRALRVGPLRDGRIEVLSGLAAGERIGWNQ